MNKNNLIEISFNKKIISFKKRFVKRFFLIHLQSLFKVP